MPGLTAFTQALLPPGGQMITQANTIRPAYIRQIRILQPLLQGKKSGESTYIGLVIAQSMRRSMPLYLQITQKTL
jgi:hypothetical protein